MNINVYLENDLALKLDKAAKNKGQSRNFIIREALKVWLTNETRTKWPKEVLNFKGLRNFEGFEKYRDNKKDNYKDPFK